MQSLPLFTSVGLGFGGKIAKITDLLSRKPTETNKTINYQPGKHYTSSNHTKKRPQFHTIIFE